MKCGSIVIEQGWAWRCLKCGEHNATWQDREMCEAAADKHWAECETSAEVRDQR